MSPAANSRHSSIVAGRYVLPEAARRFVRNKAAAGGAIAPEVSEQKSRAGRKGRAMQLEAMRADE
jgi:hypothetical protein